MEWQFRNDSPIYTQLTQRLTQAIVAGEFRPGERLPSVRELAVEAGVNPNTVQRALADLERDGLVFSQRTAGRFVTGDVSMTRSSVWRINVWRIFSPKWQSSAAAETRSSPCCKAERRKNHEFFRM